MKKKFDLPLFISVLFLIIFGVVISTIFMGTEVYLKKLSLEWIKQYAVKLMGTITGIIFLFLFISICFGIRNIIRIEREE